MTFSPAFIVPPDLGFKVQFKASAAGVTGQANMVMTSLLTQELI